MSRSSYWLLTGPVLVTLFGACSAADPGAEAQAVGSTAGLSHEVRARHERVRAFFRDRAQSESVAQTRTESGTVVDWLPKPGNLPALPPTPAAFKDGLTPAARTELQAQPEARGPAGTVPRVRFDVEAYLRAVGEQVPEDPSQVLNEGPDRELKLDELLKFPRARLPSAVRSVAGLLDVSPAGAEAGVTRLALGRGVRSQRESIVVGASLDDQPTLFTYYTTNGSRSAGDWLGGFDQRQAGFCQVSQTVVAGERLALPRRPRACRWPSSSTMDAGGSSPQANGSDFIRAVETWPAEKTPSRAIANARFYFREMG